MRLQTSIALYRGGKAGEAIPLAQRVLEIREKALCAGHDGIAIMPFLSAMAEDDRERPSYC